MERGAAKLAKGPQSSYYRSLTRNMVINILLVALAPMLLLGVGILYEFNSAYKSKVEDHLEELVLKHQQNIDGFLERQLGVIRFLAHSFSLEELGDTRFLRQTLDNLQREYGPYFVDLGLVDEQGLQQAYAGPFMLEQASYSQADWFQRAIDSRSFVSDVFLGLRSLPHFIVAVRKEVDGRTWILRSTVDFLAFNKLVESIRVGRTGFAYILNHRGELQTKNVFGSSQPSELVALSPTPQVQKGIRVRRVEDAKGESFIVVTAPLKHGEWMLVYQQSESDAFQDLRRTMSIAVLISILGAAGIVMLVLFQSRRMVSHVAKADLAKAKMDQQVVEAGRLASIGELAAGIAHEINNPVAIMVEEAGWLEDLMEDGKYGEEELAEFRRSLDQIGLQGQRCKEITHKLLHFARRTDSRLQPVQLNDVARELVSLCLQRAKYSKVALETSLETDLPMITASPSEMQQVILNLINNALDALSKEGGTIRIATRTIERDGKTGVVLKVADDGPGIPEANLIKIFDPFFTTKPVGKGTGLGLSICYGIIRKLGGEITVESEVNKGTTFRIFIPRTQSDQPAFLTEDEGDCRGVAVEAGESGEEAS